MISFSSFVRLLGAGLLSPSKVDMVNVEAEGWLFVYVSYTARCVSPPKPEGNI